MSRCPSESMLREQHHILVMGNEADARHVLRPFTRDYSTSCDSALVRPLVSCTAGTRGECLGIAKFIDVTGKRDHETGVVAQCTALHFHEKAPSRTTHLQTSANAFVLVVVNP